MSTVGSWYPMRVVSSTKPAGYPGSSYTLATRPIWIPERNSYVCLWVTSAGLLRIRDLGSDTNLATFSAPTYTASISGGVYLGGYLYFCARDNSNAATVSLWKMNMSTLATTKLVSIRVTRSGTTTYFDVTTDGTDLYVAQAADTDSRVYATKVTTAGSGTFLGSIGSASTKIGVVAYGVTMGYFHFAAKIDGGQEQFQVSTSGGIPTTPTTGYIVMGYPAYHYKDSGNVLYDETESNSWDLGARYARIVGIVDEATPKLIMWDGPTYDFFEGATKKYSQPVAGNAIPVFGMLAQRKGVFNLFAAMYAATWNEYTFPGKEVT